MNILVSNYYYLYTSIKARKITNYIEVVKLFSPKFLNPLLKNNKISIFKLGI